MHVLPRVGELHERFPDVLSVIGVHAGKYPAERHTDRIAEACQRLGVHHPVVNDRQFRIWHDWGVHAWPTVALVDPEGYAIGVQSGEFDIDAMAEAIEAIVARARERGSLRPGPDPLAAAGHVATRDAELRFPTKAIVAGERLWVSDSGNRRVLECAWELASASAEVLLAHDGIDEPRGLCEWRGAVHVAERRGHRVLRIGGDGLEPIAGTGRLAEWRIEEGEALTRDLRSPWGLAAMPGGLAVAMAGAHQLWLLGEDGTLRLLAGTGAEAIEDGAAAGALLAQPTGVSALGESLVFADSESSAVRALDGGRVRTLVGTGLFDFGDRDGVGDEVLLQHCEDVAVQGRRAAIADTYNDRLKLLDAPSRECRAWPGAAGEPGALREPGGVAWSGELLLVADTGNHRIVIVEPDGSLREVVFA